jgi:uncharacterized protein
MFSQNFFDNNILLCALIAWIIAQAIKVPIEYIKTKKMNWVLLLRPGGMPSSHSALISGLAHAAGLYFGFGSPFFGISFVIAMIIIYDATGVRRQAGKHAEIINKIITDLASGHPLKDEQLWEVLGHTPLEAIAGMLLGIIIAQLYWLIGS